MYKIKGNIFAKIAAFLLLSVSAVTFVLSLIGIAYLDNDPSFRNYDSYFESSTCSSTLEYAARRIYDDVEEGGWRAEHLSNNWYRQRDTWGDVHYIVCSPEGELVSQSLNAPSLENAGHIHTLTAYDYVVKTYVDRDITYGVGSANMEKTLFDFTKTFSELFTVAVFVSFITLLTSIGFLVLAAGRRTDVEEIVLNPIDRIPLDLYLAGIAALCGLGIACIYYTAYYMFESLFAIAIPIGAVCYIMLLSVTMTIITRLKFGSFWENTLIFRFSRRAWNWLWKWSKWLWIKIRVILSFVFGKIFGRAIGNAFGRTFGRMFGSIKSTMGGIPLIWKVALVTCGVIFIEFMFFMLGIVIWDAIGLLVVLFILFNIALMLFIMRLALDMVKLKSTGNSLASGDLDKTVDTSKMLWDFKIHGDNLNSIAQGISLAVDKQMKSERLKTELITNVSHDIKTPLTSIVNYIDLLKKEELDGKAAEYLEVLDRQSARLKKLTEDLVEASKASTGNISVNLTRTDLGEIARQSAGEYSERLDSAKLNLVMNIPENAPHIMADGKLLWRIIDNLLSNAYKYSQPATRIYFDIRRTNGKVSLSVKNISRDMLNINPEELTERFVRGDLSRNTDGSGLGLNIARSLTELQNGTFNVLVDGDLFKAELIFNEIG